MINASILKTFYKKTIPYIWGYGFFCTIVRSTFSNSSFAWLWRLPVKPGLTVNVKFSQGSIILTKPERCSIAKKFFWTDGKIQPKNNSSLCLTVSDEFREGGGGTPVHLIRTLTLESCDDAISSRQKWGFRKNN